MKTCTVCKQQKSFSDFYNRKASEDGKAYRCKVCDNHAVRQYRRKNQKNWSQIQKRANRLHKHGITQDQFDKMYIQQNGKCNICNCELDINLPPKDTKRVCVIDHCHTSGTVRGLLCTKCNQALGLFNDNVNSLKKAIQYLSEIH